jgi:peptidyl-prolyl cis-trans isomerase D
MITVLRKHHRWLMIVIAILAIPFVFYFNKTDLSAARQSDLGRIYDRPITRVEFQRSVRLLNLASRLGMSLVQDLTMGAKSESDYYVEFTWNRLILQHEAQRLGIRPTQTEIVEFVKTLQPFRGASGFDLSKYTEFTQTMLPSLGFNESQIEELVSDQLTLNRMKELLGTGTQIAASESKETYEQIYGKLDVAVVRLRSEDFQKDVKISDEDIAKYYEAHKAQLKSDEKRRVEFVTFALTEADKKLAGKERVDVLQKLANYANDFTQALLEKNANFGELAIKFHGSVAATGEFTAAKPDPQFASNPQLAQYAFQLTQTEPFSDAIQTADAFYVLHLLGITEARPLSLEEAKPKIVEALKTERVQQLTASKGADVARQIREALKAGTPPEKAVESSGLKLERVPAFSLTENPIQKIEKDKTPKPPDAPDLQMIRSAVSELNPGETTDFVPTGTGGLVAMLEKREPVEPATYEQGKELFESQYLQRKRAIVFYEWLQDRRRAAGVQEATG